MKKIVIIILLVILIPVGYYLISPFFIDIYVDEAAPQSINPNTSTNVELSTQPVQIIDTAIHPASGTVRIVSSENKNFLRYENFKTINGPDIYVYLAKDIDAKEYIDLGRVKATEGNINYEIPDGVNPREYPFALVWCKKFDVLFNSAKLY